MSDPFSGEIPRSLSDLKEIGCKSAWAVHISPLYWSIEQLLTCKIGKICPRPAEFSPRFFKSDRLLAGRAGGGFRILIPRVELLVDRSRPAGGVSVADRPPVEPHQRQYLFGGRRQE